jgi:opacity protein-like surface antigen
MAKQARLMWSWIKVFVIFGLLSLTAAAQKVELFGGYQFTHLRPAFNASGWNASLTGNFKHVLGITADFSGTYKENVNVHTYTVGPVFTAHLPIVQPFVHALFGGITASNGESHSGFAMLIGGGLDLGLRKGIGFRIVQADWLSTRFAGNTNNSNMRASTGIVIKF